MKTAIYTALFSLQHIFSSSLNHKKHMLATPDLPKTSPKMVANKILQTEPIVEKMICSFYQKNVGSAQIMNSLVRKDASSIDQKNHQHFCQALVHTVQTNKHCLEKDDQSSCTTEKQNYLLPGPCHLLKNEPEENHVALFHQVT